MPQRLIERALRVWREADAILESLDPTTPDAARVRRASNEAQSAYLSLVDTTKPTTDLLERCRHMIEEAESELRGLDTAPTDNAA